MDAISPHDRDIAVSVPGFAFDKAIYLRAVDRTHTENILKFIQGALLNPFHFYLYLGCLEIYLKEEYASSSFYDKPWEAFVTDQFEYFIDLLRDKTMFVLDQGYILQSVTFMEPSTFILGCNVLAHEPPAPEYDEDGYVL